MDRRWLMGLAVAALAIAPRRAGADDVGFSIGSRPVWFVSAGASGGASLATEDRGGFVGGELSVVRLRDARFLGLYADALYDFGADGTYLTAGPELGWIRRSRTMPLAFGLDGGGVLRLTDDTAVGATGRLFVTVAGMVSIYGRYAYLDADDDAHVVQLGMTIKFPLGPPFGAGAR